MRILASSPAPPPADVGEPGRAGAEAGRADAGAARPPTRRRIDDRALMAALIPGFGLGIPHLTGLFGPLTPADAAWWWGHAWFVGGAATIYLSNRALLFAGRARADWFSRPWARLALLFAGILFGTVPPTWLMLRGWSALSGVDVGGAGEVVLLVNVICVLFVTWLYETLFLIRERVDDQLRVERAQAARAQAELAALRAQVDPHFLFNALNTLSGLVEARPADARAFVEDLARVYRALLDSRGRALVPLAEELELARAYAGLLHLRFGDAVRVEVAPVPPAGWSVPPGAVQLLLENVVRHNAVDPADPLPVRVGVEGDRLLVTHPRRPRPPRPGAGLGLANLDARCRAATGRAVEVHAGAEFRVAVPLARTGVAP